MIFAVSRKAVIILLAAGIKIALASNIPGQEEANRTPVDIRLGSGLRIVSLKPGAGGLPRLQRMAASRRAAGFVAGAQAVETPYVRPPLFGFSPKVATTFTDRKKHTFDQDMAHVLSSTPGLVGSPLNPPAEENFVIGVLDSGANTHLVAEPYSVIAGLTGFYLTSNPFEAGGVGGSLEGLVSKPIGLFAAGLGAVQSNGQLDVSTVVGHYNVAVFVTEEVNCGQGEVVTALIGLPLMTFYKSVIRVSEPREVTVGGETYQSPDVQLLPLGTTLPLAQFPRAIPMSYAADLPLPPQTAAFSYSIDYEGFPDFDTPSMPSVLAWASTLPSAGVFVGEIGLLEGEPGPLNPLRFFRVLVDTGAQASIITPTTAASLSLDLQNPDFVAEVCGVGGLQTDVPGFYVDLVRINASGGALDFGEAPFIVYDLPAIGGPLQGILGMNFFWNRDVIFDVEPTTGSGFLRLSNPMAMPYGDFDQDLDVDEKDLAAFVACMSGPAIPQLDPACAWFDADLDEDVDQSDFGVFQACISGKGVRADVNCGPAW